MTEHVEEIRRMRADEMQRPLSAGRLWSGDDMDVLLTALAQAERSMYAYAGALGYPIPADQDGRLLDGTFPKCGLCEAKDQLVAQAERERDEFKEAFRQQSAFTEEVIQKWDAARAEVERLKGEEVPDILVVTPKREFLPARCTRCEQAEAALARVRAALEGWLKLKPRSVLNGVWSFDHQDITRHVDESRAALEGRVNNPHMNSSEGK